MWGSGRIMQNNVEDDGCDGEGDDVDDNFAGGDDVDDDDVGGDEVQDIPPKKSPTKSNASTFGTKHFSHIFVWGSCF